MANWQSPLDMHRECGYGDEADYSEPRESCPDCGEWLREGQTATECETCAANRDAEGEQ